MKALIACGALLAAAGTAGCTQHRGAPAVARAGLSGDQRRLAELAQRAQRSAYDATYSFSARVTGETGRIRIVSAPPQYRVEISAGGSTALFFSIREGAVSCSVKPARPASCLLVAHPGARVPSLFDPGVQHLFSDAVAGLAADPGGYTVAAVAGTGGSKLAGECFRVVRLPAPSRPGAPAPAGSPPAFEAGTYCFTGAGLLTSVAVSTGSLTLLSSGPAPAAALFRPPATPRPLPASRSAAPSPG